MSDAERPDTFGQLSGTHTCQCVADLVPQMNPLSVCAAAGAGAEGAQAPAAVALITQHETRRNRFDLHEHQHVPVQTVWTVKALSCCHA